ncbi:MULTISPECIES: carbamoyltransferase C-terminal domain-containing protein [Halocynthiibacter]|uniref:3-hydroxymethylcephem carbamoyltransferase n=1 Tax=Halocynthiibacter halioticoli TaxID=2986804 RepID=A0AAE3J0C8_9RHOB|nr:MULTISPECIES: carbamoyltransferase C-terminal domain-containing protein [Halocynthiibacter]MCV6825438.1 3-hydroxymethylcephem carbamoyltransferase [Halocynthiibacter halioticoli]MCW4058439.1 3-hydroxymethylcephem carbamoyltransferase [Halocynthiibacter sp. SDUM655004]
MKILSFKPGHDGTIAGIDTDRGDLLFSYEAEKDSFLRNSSITPDAFMDAALWFKELPDVLSLSGWSGTSNEIVSTSGAGYFGIGEGSEVGQKKGFFGKNVDFYSSTHERSHIWSTYAMSPFPQGEPCYVLVWEGELGEFYEIDQKLQVKHLGRVLDAPGNKFSFLYFLASAGVSRQSETVHNDEPGKLLAASAAGKTGPLDKDEQEVFDFIFGQEGKLSVADKRRLEGSPFFNIGVDSQKFKDLAAKVSDAIFQRFFDFAKANLDQSYPLLIAGGGGLNCDWNTRWRESKLFKDVFVPPCTNDTGSAIGTAVDAMRHFTGRAKLEWTVYSGQPFLDDIGVDHMEDVAASEVNLAEVAAALYRGEIIGWARGNCEIGPRALGNRSVLAAPFSKQTSERLNEIKGRELSKPIAPACLEEDVSKHFDWSGPSPYMMYFQKVTDPQLEAIRHVDESARVQTVTRDQNASFYDLLTEFKKVSGVGVLCNTSLNFVGSGFINRTSDLYDYAKTVGLDGFVAGLTYYRFLKQ